MVEIFDRVILRKRRERVATAGLGDAGFLIDWTGEQIFDRLGDIKRDFSTGVQIGLRGSVDFSSCAQDFYRMDMTSALTPDIVADEEFLPFADGSLDVVISHFALHSTNDLPGVLVQIRRALKPDGLFIAAMPGGETLRELRESLTQAEMTVSGGISPRVMPFADKPQMGDLLQRAGFALPVVDSDIVRVSYPDMFALMRDLRAMGENSIIHDRQTFMARRDMMMEAARYYAGHFSDGNGKIEASFEIIFLIGWAPHESQQKPLKPGSAEVRLADVLNKE